MSETRFGSDKRSVCPSAAWPAYCASLNPSAGANPACFRMPRNVPIASSMRDTAAVACQFVAARYEQTRPAAAFGDYSLSVQVADLLAGHLREQKVRALALAASRGQTEGLQSHCSSYTSADESTKPSLPAWLSGDVALRRRTGQAGLF